MSACRSCGAPIRWVVTVNGARMPVDADPVPDGNLVLSDPTPSAYSPVALYVALVVDPAQTMLDDPPRFVSHYVTCPDADSWRKPR